MDNLPFFWNFDQPDVLRALSRANNRIGELNGVVRLLPNPDIILNAILLGEAKDSSEIENIVTTFDEVYRDLTVSEMSPETKEVANYRKAMLLGTRFVREKRMITTNLLVDLHEVIDPGRGGIRKLPGMVVLDSSTGEILHTPPQSESEIRDLLDNLERYLNESGNDTVDPLVKMAVIHYQFESIHPFYDGNGRTGRILNILYLLLSGKLSEPVLYLSKYINQNKSAYYSLLKRLREDDSAHVDYLLYMLEGISQMSDFTIRFIDGMNRRMKEAEELIRVRSPKLDAREIVAYLFRDFYTKNELFRAAMGISRNTATTRLRELERIGLLTAEKIGKEMLFKNAYLFELVKEW